MKKFSLFMQSIVDEVVLNREDCASSRNKIIHRTYEVRWVEFFSPSE